MIAHPGVKTPFIGAEVNDKAALIYCFHKYKVAAYVVNSSFINVFNKRCIKPAKKAAQF